MNPFPITSVLYCKNVQRNTYVTMFIIRRVTKPHESLRLNLVCKHVYNTYHPKFRYPIQMHPPTY